MQQGTSSYKSPLAASQLGRFLGVANLGETQPESGEKTVFLFNHNPAIWEVAYAMEPAGIPPQGHPLL